METGRPAHEGGPVPRLDHPPGQAQPEGVIMKNSQVAKVFQDIADFLELKGEVPFKVRAYQKAARTIEHLPVEVEQLMAEGRLRQVPGVGDAIAKKITELLTTGRLEYYEKLRAEFPEGITTLLDIPGIGPKTALRLVSELGVRSVEDLEAALAGGKVASLYRLGDKTAENILRHLQSLRTKEQRIPLGVALPQVEDIISSLRERCEVHNLTPAGSLRRFKETVGDVDLMGTADNAQAVIDTFTGLAQVRQVLAKGSTKASIVTDRDLQVDLRVVEHDAFGSLLQYFTGSKQHNIALRERGRRRGLKLSEYGITDLKTGRLEKFAAEEDFYRRLGLPLIPPELREGEQELETAERGAIPTLVELGDIKGDLHVHTNWSDGRDSLETMVAAARALGYQYLAITEHSRGRGIAHGLDEGRLRQQMTEIRRLNESLDGFTVLSGIEVDIRADGSLDLPDEMLADLDVVIAAVHSALGQDEARMTRRLLAAIENRHVDIIAHPTARLLGEREPVAVDMEAVFRAAARTGTALEINAMPDRLDLKDSHVFRARELGVKLTLGSDAHAAEHLALMRYGVGTARRGWCEARHILNTLPVGQVLASLKGR
ncbi:MAG: DNA polymerase/3'-5' exonuclease PolX [Chloroflexi bacterium]|nr:MAG: DNA polymerase/3'-5' exonuclease PolX [Chloroflexota bacterium]